MILRPTDIQKGCSKFMNISEKRTVMHIFGLILVLMFRKITLDPILDLADDLSGYSPLPILLLPSWDLHVPCIVWKFEGNKP